MNLHLSIFEEIFKVGSYSKAKNALENSKLSSELIENENEYIKKALENLNNSIKKSRTLTSREEAYLSSIISCENQTELAFAIKPIFEQEKQDEININLTIFVLDKEKEIEEICKNSFYNFIKSVDNLFSVRCGTDNLKQSIVDLNSELQLRGQNLLKELSDLVESRFIIQNLTDTFEALNKLLCIINLTEKARQYITQERYYPAIKILEQIQNFHLKSINKYEFGRFLERRIPEMKIDIKKRVLMNVSEWLSLVRIKSLDIGKFSFAQINQELKKNKITLTRKKAFLKDDSFDRGNATYNRSIKVLHSEKIAECEVKAENSVADRIYSSFAKKTKGSSALSKTFIDSGAIPNVTSDNSPKILQAIKSKDPLKKIGSIDDSKNDITETSVFDAINLNFAPLYQCLYIHDILGEKEEFKKYYKENRKLQSNLALRISENFWKDYENYLCSIAGFFIIESTVLHTLGELTNKDDVDALWDMVSNKMRSFFQVQIAQCQEIAKFSDLQTILLLFCRTLKKYGYEVSILINFVQVSLRDHYVTFYMENILSRTRKLLQDPLFNSCLSLEDEKDYKDLILKSGLNIFFQDAKKRTFPFSGILTSLVGIIQTFIYDLFCFSYNLSNPKFNLKKTTYLLIHNILTEFQNIGVDKNKTLFIGKRFLDYFWLTKALVLFERQIHVLTNYSANITKHDRRPCNIDYGFDSIDLRNSGECSELKSSNLDETYRIFEEKLYKANILLVESFFQNLTAKFPLQGSKSITQPHAEISDLLAIIDNDLKNLEELPNEIIENIYIRNFKIISEKMMNFILSDSMGPFDTNFINNLSVDLQAIKDLAKRAPFHNLFDPFLELEEILDLLNQSDLKIFLNPTIRATKYSHISSNKRLVSILNKYKESSGIGIFRINLNKRKEVKDLIIKLT